jgi:hypothetical protein
MRAGAFALVASALVALGVVGCGSPSASLVSLRGHATRVCTQAQVRGAAIRPPAVPTQTAAFLRRGIGLLRSEVAGLRALRAPSDAAHTYSTALGALARELTILTGTAHDLDRGADPFSTIKVLQRRLAPVEAENDAAWRALGVPACVNR